MFAFIWLIDQVLNLYSWCFILLIVLSWLVTFGIINPNLPIIWQIGRFLTEITNPILRPIQRIIPSIAGIDLSPVIAILLIGFIRISIIHYVVGR